MENASKALLIAGAILLVIALIAVGMSIFGTARGVVDKAEGQVDNMKVQLHNNQFIPYGGKEKTLSQVKELLSVFLNNNNGKSNTDEFYIDEISCRSYEDSIYYGTMPISKFAEGINALHPKVTSNSSNVGGNAYFKDSLYDVKLIYNENGIINQIILYRYLKFGG